ATAIARPPAPAISATTASTPARSMSTTPTAAPSLAKRSAPARPMPEAAAVTMPILFCKRTGVPPCYAASPPPQDLSSTCGGLGSWCRWVTHPKIAAPAVATGGQSGKRHGLHRDQRRRIASAGCPHPCDRRIARKLGRGGAAPWPSLTPVVLATSLPGAGARRSRDPRASAGVDRAGRPPLHRARYRVLPTGPK